MYYLPQTPSVPSKVQCDFNHKCNILYNLPEHKRPYINVYMYVNIKENFVVILLMLYCVIYDIKNICDCMYARNGIWCI